MIQGLRGVCLKCSTGISIERKMKKPLTIEDILLKHGHYMNTETGVVFVIPDLKDLIKELEGVK